jgi:hypothetical protein
MTLDFAPLAATSSPQTIEHIVSKRKLTLYISAGGDGGILMVVRSGASTDS